MVSGFEASGNTIFGFHMQITLLPDNPGFPSEPRFMTPTWPLLKSCVAVVEGDAGDDDNHMLNSAS